MKFSPLQISFPVRKILHPELALQRCLLPVQSRKQWDVAIVVLTTNNTPSLWLSSTEFYSATWEESFYLFVRLLVMASPFAVFRRYQAAFLVIFGVLIIVIFTIGDSVSRLTDTGGGENKDPVVVRWEGTELTESQLQGLQYAKQDVLNALYAVQNAAIAKGAFPRFLQQATMRQQMGLPVSRPGMLFTETDLDREEIVRTRILAEWASQIGMVVPDAEIAEHLRQISDNQLSWDQMREILRGGENTKYTRSLKALNAMIREKLLAQKALALSFAALGELTPGQQLGYFARSNRQIEIDVLEIPVSDFVDQVSDPDSKELQAYFEKYKHQTPLFNTIAGVSYESPDPGFKLPHRVAVDFVKVNVDQEIEKWLDQVTDEEIAAYYEENKRIDQQLQVVDALTLPSAEDFAPEDDGDESSEGQPQTEAAQAEQAEIEGSDVKPSEESGADEEKTVPPTDDSGHRRGRVKIQQVAFSAAQPGAEEAEVDAVKSSEAEKSTDTGTEQEKPGASASGEETPDTAATTTTNSTAAQDDPPPLKEPTYKPLEEVRDYVRQKVAEKKAADAIEVKFKAIRRRVVAFAAARQYEEGRDIAPPEVKQLAESEGLDGVSVPLQDAWSFQRDTDIGRSVQRQPQSRGRPFGGEIDYTSLVFQEGNQTFWQAIETTDDENNRYLSWKTAEKLPEVPTLDGPERERVVRVWKQGAGRQDAQDSARKRAVARAEEMLTRLKGGESFDAIAATMPGSRRLATEAFSWLTSGSAPMMNPFAPARLRLSQIDGVDQPGSAFMESAFALDVGEAGVGVNHPQTHVYLLQVTFQNKSREILEQDFLNNMDDPRTGREVQSAAQLDWQQLGERWFNELDRSVALEWLNPAARFGR